MRVVVKDCIALAGHRSSFGHPRWRETHAEAKRDAEVLTRLLAKGAALAGLAKMDQLAYSLIGNAGEGEPPVNTYDPACFCGGSSSGSASAVAGGLAELGVGTDTCGSIRVPAAACGLFSIRPTHGRVGVEGVLPLARSLDVVGFLARDPALLERALAAAATAASGASAAWRGGFRRVSSPDEAVMAELVNSEIGDLMARIQGREIWADHATWVEQNIDALDADVQQRLRRCETLSHDSEAVIAADLEQREEYRVRVRSMLGDDGVLVMPVLPRRGPRRDWSQAELLAFRQDCFRLTAPSSLAGVPQVVLAGAGPPAGGAVSLIGPADSDEALLTLAREFTSAGTDRAATDPPR